MSSTQLSDIAKQKLQQIHSLVVSFQALESDLKDTFEDIERKHQNEKKQLQNEINKLKGIEPTESNKDKQPQATTSPRAASNSYAQPQQYNNYNSNGYGNRGYGQQQQQQQQPSQPQHRQQNGSVSGGYNNTQLQQNNSNHNYNRTPLSYQQQQRQQQQQQYGNNNNHAKQTHSVGNGMVPPPPSQPTPAWKKNNGQQPQQNASNGTKNKTDDEKENDKKKINSVSTQQANKAKPKGGGNMFQKMFASKDTKSNNPELNELGSGISEREFYKKYWIEAGKIGEGAFARVRKITRKSDKAVFALKMIKKKGKSEEDILALQREILVLQKCNHKNIVGLGDWCDTKKRIYMVVEFCDGGDVFERVVQYKKFSEKSAIHVVSQVAEGLKHVHLLKYVHRDLKPDNLMYLTKDIDSQIKIIDFGLAGDCNIGLCKTPCGTAHYAAPEVLSSVEYDMSADLWSLGVIVYTLLCGFPPFFDASNNMKNLYHLIKKGQYSFPSPFWDEISDPAKDLIKKLLNKDPKQRLTAEQVLKHEWVTQAKNEQNDKDLGNTYVKQMSHWQSTRQATEFGLGQEQAPPPPDKPINLYYNQQQQ